MGACLRNEKGKFTTTFSSYTKLGVCFKASNGLQRWAITRLLLRWIVRWLWKMSTNSNPNRNMALIIISVALFFQILKTMQLSLLDDKQTEAFMLLQRAALSHSYRNTFDVISTCIASIIINVMS
jgi:hypothetical protein